MTKYITMLLLAPLIAYGQEMPKIQFNHLYYVLEPTDFKAISESGFVNDTLCARETRADSTATYLFGPSNYLELFESSGNDALLGFSGIAFSVDRIGDLKKLRDILYKTHKPAVRTHERDIDGKKAPWFDALAIVTDSSFHAESRIFLWVMEYRIEHFKQKRYTIRDSQLTREHYLEKYASQRANKILKRFTGVVMRLDSSEKEYMTEFLRRIEYRRIGENHFIAPDNFRFLLKDRQPDDRKAIESIEFETSTHFAEKTTFRISDNVFVVLTGNDGRLVFR